MRLELPAPLVDRLRAIADAQGRAVEDVAAEALRRFLDSGRPGDLGSTAAGETQLRLLPELSGVDPWAP